MLDRITEGSRPEQTQLGQTPAPRRPQSVRTDVPRKQDGLSWMTEVIDTVLRGPAEVGTTLAGRSWQRSVWTRLQKCERMRQRAEVCPEAQRWEYTMRVQGVVNVKKIWISEVKILPHTIHKNKLNIRHDTRKLLEENIGKKFSGINSSSIFLDQSPKAKEIKAKISKWNLIKFKNFCIPKKTVNKMKRHPTEWEKIFTNCAVDEGVNNQNI